MRKSLLRLIWLIGLLGPLGLQAQVHPPAVRHNCWDIELEIDHTRPPFLPPHTVATTDSGTLAIAIAKQYLGTPYHYGGKTPKGFDCAGFARYVYLQFGYELPPYSGGQARVGTEVSDTRNLQPGDLVFFGGRHHTKTVGHTGIAIEADPESGTFTFIHAATHGGVIISRSTEPYYKQRYLTARRIFR